MKSTFFRVLFALVALFCVSPVMSQTLVFNLPGGTVSKVPLPATFSVTPSGDKIVIESGSARYELEKERVLAMYYQGAKGDVNDDGKVTITDAVNVVNIILNGGSEEGGKAPEGVEAVDLGLPSGLKWANMNVGASKAEDYGDYFAWGETEPQSSNTYNWPSYKWCNGSETTLTKYCNKSSYGNNGFTDGKTVLDLEDDAARANWGGDWRMPTKADIDELLANTTNEWTTQNGVNGYKFTSKSNGNSIFLPAAGNRWNFTLWEAGSYASYWSSSLHESYPNNAWRLDFSSEYVYKWNYYGRYRGQSVRPVR